MHPSHPFEIGQKALRDLQAFLHRKKLVASANLELKSDATVRLHIAVTGGDIAPTRFTGFRIVLDTQGKWSIFLERPESGKVDRADNRVVHESRGYLRLNGVFTRWEPPGYSGSEPLEGRAKKVFKHLKTLITTCGMYHHDRKGGQMPKCDTCPHQIFCLNQ